MSGHYEAEIEQKTQPAELLAATIFIPSLGSILLPCNFCTKRVKKRWRGYFRAERSRRLCQGTVVKKQEMHMTEGTSAQVRGALLAGLIIGFPMTASGQTIWSAGAHDITFSKAAFADPTLAANQDRITSLDWITRGSTMGLYNAEQEPGYNNNNPPVSPLDTLWAFSGQNGNPVFSYGQGASEFSSLTLTDWEDSLGSTNNLANIIVGTPGVVHLISSDTYIDVEFTAWGQGTGAGGSFTYVRASTPVPEPTALVLLSLGSLIVLSRRSLARRLPSV
jgi:hypothetical protein